MLRLATIAPGNVLSWWALSTIVETLNCSAQSPGRLGDSVDLAAQSASHPAHVAIWCSQEISKGSKSALRASVAADSVLLPNARANTQFRGSSPMSATLPGPASGYSQVIAPLRAKSCQPSLKPT